MLRRVRKITHHDPYMSRIRDATDAELLLYQAFAFQFLIPMEGIQIFYLSCSFRWRLHVAGGLPLE
jgi:hypothetical protein